MSQRFLVGRRRVNLDCAVGGCAIAPINPASLSPIVWFDFSDLTTLFQDTGGTSPVTADGQAIRRINMTGYAPGVGVGNPYAVAVGAGGYPGDICLAAGIQAETPVWAATYNPATTPAVKLYSGGVDNNPTYLIDNLVTNQSWNNNTLDIGGNVPNGLFYVGYVGEVVLYNQLLSTGQIAGVSQYLKNKWGST